MQWIAGDRNKESLKERGTSFRELVSAIAEGGLQDVIQNPDDDQSRIALIKVGDKVWATPFENRNGKFRIITAYLQD